MIEGVWPHVRDDDWCGEFKGSSRRADPRVTADAMTPSTMLPIGTGASLGARPSNVAPFSSGDARSEQPRLARTVHVHGARGGLGTYPFNCRATLKGVRP